MLETGRQCGSCLCTYIRVGHVYVQVTPIPDLFVWLLFMYIYLRGPRVCTVTPISDMFAWLMFMYIY